MIPETTIEQILIDNNCPKVIDYLSIDIEPSSLIAIENFPFNLFKFKFLTFEHDLYANRHNERCKKMSYEILIKNGYFRFAENVPTENTKDCFFEDWWIGPEFFSPNFIVENIFKEKSGKFILDNIKI
jgi:hypothetical protein